MIERKIQNRIEKALKREAAVILLGPRQVGKTTLAHAIAKSRPSIYLDLERANDRHRLSSPWEFCAQHEDKLVILDEIHHVPELFDELRGIIDEGRRNNKGRGRFLILGSASMDLMQQSESLAGRVAYIDMTPINVHDLDQTSAQDVARLWLRGGFPNSYLSEDEEISFERRSTFIRSYLERDVPMFAPRMPSARLMRLWTMIAHQQGGLLNTSQLARSLEVSAPVVSRYIDLLSDLLLIRKLPPFFVNTKKRLVKSPKTYIRDSGLAHALLNIETFDDLLSYPSNGDTWEGFVIENILSITRHRTLASFYRTQKGAEIDLILEMGAKGTWAIEIKRGLAPSLGRGFHEVLEDIKPDKTFVIYSGEDRYPRGEGIDVISLPELVQEIVDLN